MRLCAAPVPALRRSGVFCRPSSARCCQAPRCRRQRRCRPATDRSAAPMAAACRPYARRAGRLPPCARHAGRVSPCARRAGRVSPGARRAGRVSRYVRRAGRVRPYDRRAGRVSPSARRTDRARTCDRPARDIARHHDHRGGKPAGEPDDESRVPRGVGFAGRYSAKRVYGGRHLCGGRRASGGDRGADRRPCDPPTYATASPSRPRRLCRTATSTAS